MSDTFKPQDKKFVDDRVSEFKEFITQMRREYKGKCSPSQWDLIVHLMKQDLTQRQKTEHLNDG